MNSHNLLTHPILSLAFFVSAIMLSCSAIGQPLESDQQRLAHAKELYNQGAFEAARSAFVTITDPRFDAEKSYYMAVSAIKANNKDGELLMNTFVGNYPLHQYSRTAYVVLAQYYFQNEEYQKAIDFYSKTSLDFDMEAVFNKGYSEFKLKKYEDAQSTFSKLDGTFSVQEKDAAYYQGFISYENGENETAKDYLIKAQESDQYRKPATILLAAMHYDDKQYDALLKLLAGKEGLDDEHLLQLQADAQFALKKYKSASETYEKLTAHPSARNAHNYYKGGFSHFKIADNEKAIDYLRRAAIDEDTVGAYASYYLGQLYAKEGNLEFAISAFENSAKLDSEVKEDALYYQAGLMMEVPRIEAAIEVLKDYSDQFANGKYFDEVNQMTGLAYANTNNYDLAIEYIERLDRLTPLLKQTYQRTSFLKGANLFNDKDFAEATEYFQKALIHDMNKEITQKTFYWMAEAKSLLGELDEALFYYNSVSNTPDRQIYRKSIYGKSYVNFNQKNYEEAARGFRQFESFGADDFARYNVDTWLRLGDCMFAMKSYQEGIRYYKKAESKGDNNKAYIYYQIGLLYRYLDDDRNAKEYFEQLIRYKPNGQKEADAYFQLAQIEFKGGNDRQAIKSYQQFLDKFPSNPLVPFALLNQAIAYDNAGEVNACISNYKSILDNHPRHKTANSALLGLQDKHTAGQFDEFNQYLTIYKNANPDSEALENIEFETARSKYYNQNYEESVTGFKQFIGNYTQSSLVTDAQYLIGESYYRMEKWQLALDAYQVLSGQEDYSKYPKVLYRLASLHSQLNDLENGNKYYYKLASVSSTRRNTLYVLNGLMQNHHTALAYDSAVHYGELLLSNARIDAWVESNAHLTVGKSYYHLAQLEQARNSFLPLVNNTPDEHGAEAYYYISKIYFDQANYDGALESLFTLTNNFQGYEKWQGAAYLLMADIYIETGELFQAKATLQSVIDHIGLEDIKSKAAEKLATIQDHVDNDE